MIIGGDINIPTNQEQHPGTVPFKETLDGLNLRTQVDFAIQHLENSLDAVITTEEDPMVNTVAQGILFSDHTTGYFSTSPTASVHTK